MWRTKQSVFLVFRSTRFLYFSLSVLLSVTIFFFSKFWTRQRHVPTTKKKDFHCNQGYNSRFGFFSDFLIFIFFDFGASHLSFITFIFSLGFTQCYWFRHFVALLTLKIRSKFFTNFMPKTFGSYGTASKLAILNFTHITFLRNTKNIL